MTPPMAARFNPGQDLPVFCDTLVRAGRFVTVKAGANNADGLSPQGDIVVSESTAGAWPLGVASRDSAPPTEPPKYMMRRVDLQRRGSIARVTSGSAVNPGDFVKSDATGRAIVAADRATACGQAVSKVAAADQILFIDLF